MADWHFIIYTCDPIENIRYFMNDLSSPRSKARVDKLFIPGVDFPIKTDLTCFSSPAHTFTKKPNCPIQFNPDFDTAKNSKALLYKRLGFLQALKVALYED